MNTTEERITQFEGLMGTFINPSMTQELAERGFFTAPSSTKYHGCYEGGLFDHSLEVMTNLVWLTNKLNLTWKNKRSPWVVGMFHDLCKMDSYLEVESGKYEYNTQTLLKGHGDKSVMLLSEFMSLTEEEILCIRYHMGAFVDKEEWNDYTRAIRKYPNVLYTHTADMMAAHISQV